jgi:hypothetical protein
MGITRKKLRKLIRESLTESRYSSEDDRRRRIRAKHMGEDPDEGYARRIFVSTN